VDTDDALVASTMLFDRVLGSVRESHWDAPSPNPGWSVHDLVNHVVGGNRRYVRLLAGASTEDVEALRNVEHLSRDPRQDFRESSAAMRAAFQAPGALTATVHHRLGDRSGAELLVMRIMEHTLHGWDLAQSIDLEIGYDADLCSTILAAIDADPTFLARSSYPECEDLIDGEPLQRLLWLTGRGLSQT
jgi:uncharacterized protein (TIGR03086 family)